MSLKKIKVMEDWESLGVPLMSQSLIYHPKLTRNIVSLLLVMHAIKFPKFFKEEIHHPNVHLQFLK
jgi:hypothetical protein